jgi:hypothetical protein
MVAISLYKIFYVVYKTFKNYFEEVLEAIFHKSHRRRYLLYSLTELKQQTIRLVMNLTDL